MIESGSDENCIPIWFAPHCKLRQVDRILRDVQGGEMQLFGMRTLLIGMESAGERDSRSMYSLDTVALLSDFVCCSSSRVG